MLDYTNTSTIARELMLAKISILGPEYAQQQMTGGPTHSASEPASEFDHQHPPAFVAAEGEQTATQAADKPAREAALARSFENSALPSPVTRKEEPYPSRQHSMTQSEALIAKNLHLAAIKTLADQFGGRVVDVAENSCIVELTAKSTRVDAFLSLIRPFGVLEAARSGESLAVAGIS